MGVVALLPALALGVGALLSVAGVRPLLFEEYTGAFRLAGGLAPAYLASFGMFGVFAGMWLWRSGYARGAWFAAGNMAVTFATGTRGAAIVALLLVWCAVMFTGRGGKRATIVARGAVAALLFAAAAVFVPLLLERTSGQGSLQGPLSGRDLAWAYFWDVFLRHPVIGNGIGHASVAAQDANNKLLQEAFVAPHNTYLQFLVDFGVVGTIVAVVAICALFKVARRATSGHTRMMVGCLGISLVVYAFFDNLLTSPQPALAFTVVLAALMNDRPNVTSGRQNQLEFDTLRDHHGAGPGPVPERDVLKTRELIPPRSHG